MKKIIFLLSLLFVTLVAFSQLPAFNAMHRKGARLKSTTTHRVFKGTKEEIIATGQDTTISQPEAPNLVKISLVYIWKGLIIPSHVATVFKQTKRNTWLAVKNVPKKPAADVATVNNVVKTE